jgi:NDP-sugar pyrophosphorylase family protein
MPMNCDVLLLAAGFGTRLRPLTNSIPKPLVEVGGKPLIVWHIERLSREGFKRVIINLHYLGEEISSYLGDGKKWGIEIEYSVETVILDTGGAIKNIKSMLLHENLLVVNSDIILGEDFYFNKVVRQHFDKNPIATLCLREEKDQAQYGEIGTDIHGRIVEFLGVLNQNVCSASVDKRRMYLGIMVMNRQIFNKFPQKSEVFSITKDVLSPVVKSGEFIDSFVYQGVWNDVGTLQRLEEAKKMIQFKQP